MGLENLVLELFVASDLFKIVHETSERTPFVPVSLCDNCAKHTAYIQSGLMLPHEGVKYLPYHFTKMSGDDNSAKRTQTREESTVMNQITCFFHAACFSRG